MSAIRPIIIFCHRLDSNKSLSISKAEFTDITGISVVMSLSQSCNTKILFTEEELDYLCVCLIMYIIKLADERLLQCYYVCLMIFIYQLY